MSLQVRHFVTGGDNGAAASYTTSTFSSSNGDLLVVAIRINAADLSAVTSVKNAAGVSFTAIPGATRLRNGGVLGMWYLPNTTGNASDAATVNFSPDTSYVGICCWDVSGAATSPYDTSATGTETNVSQTVTSATYSTAIADEIVLVLASQVVGSPWTAQASPAYHLDSAEFPNNLIALGAESLVFSSVQTNITSSMTANVLGNADITLSAFKAAPATYTISGTILDGSSNPIVGATVACTGQTSTTTNGSGQYSFTNVTGSVTVTPSLTEWTFSPTSLSISSATSSANFTGTETFYSISGALGAGGAGATVSWTAGGIFQTELGGWFLLEGGGFLELEGTSGSVTADGSGNYTIPNLVNDTYQIVPTKTGYTFSPTSRSETVSGADITGVNFTASQVVVGGFSTVSSSALDLQLLNKFMNWLSQL